MVYELGEWFVHEIGWKRNGSNGPSSTPKNEETRRENKRGEQFMEGVEFNSTQFDLAVWV